LCLWADKSVKLSVFNNKFSNNDFKIKYWSHIKVTGINMSTELPQKTILMAKNIYVIININTHIIDNIIDNIQRKITSIKYLYCIIFILIIFCWKKQSGNIKTNV